MKQNRQLILKDSTIQTIKIGDEDYICITDIARLRNSEDPNGVIANWMRNRNTIEYLGLWEYLHNPNFKPTEFEGFRHQAGLNAFTLSPSKWIESTSAIGLISKSGRYGGTFAQSDIAMKFASWVSVEFELYLLKDYQRMKAEEQKVLGWSVKRELTKLNYRIHTDAIKEHIVPMDIDAYHRSLIYANEADVLNVALFGQTAKEWREEHKDEKGNIRDYATINQLICLSNLENLNALFINEEMPQRERLLKLNQIAQQQMRILEDVENRKILTE
ncbi:MAG: KilA-N domain-containing protein [Bacteroidaceae bacterium]|nr:KilA-N domain-containing protein [Bacteroidaceae bacterium]